MLDTATRHDAVPLWHSLTLRLALAAIPLGLTTFVLISNVGWPIRLVIALALAVTLANPAHGLLLVGVLAPLGHLIAALMGAASFRIAEAIVLAFLGVWLLRAVPDRPGPRASGAPFGWLFAAAIVASIAGLAFRLGRYPGQLAAEIDQIAHLYFFIGDRIGVVDGARLLEGLGLAAATIVVFRRHPSIARTLPLAVAASGAVAAASSILLWRGIGSADALERYRLIGYRVSGHVADVNAAGSYFGMTTCVAVGVALRERGHRRAMWFALAAASGIGLWFSESRSALGATGAVLTVAAFWTATIRMSTRGRTAALAAIVVALLAGAAIRARLLAADPGYRGVGFREQFTATSVRMIEAHPLFGVGVGQYYRMSPLFLSPQLAWSYGFENAHNYFLQIGAELGVVGLGLFLVWLGAALARSARALARQPEDARLLGLGAGVVVFLMTALAGHPFLLGEVAYPFWLVFGLMAALAGSTMMNHPSRTDVAPARQFTPRTRWLIPAAATAAIMIAGVLATAADTAGAPESQAVDGFYQWETLADGTRVRWTGDYASVFVPADVTRVYMPVRLPSNGGTARPMGVEVMSGGVRKGRTLVGDAWATIEVQLPAVPPPARFKRIDLKVDRTWQPAVYLAGNADLRSVGVQVGELQMLRER